MEPESQTPARWRQRYTDYRGFLPSPRAATARDVRAIWERRVEAAGAGHPIWMHVHVPYCPQICSFCHCGKLMLTSPAQLDEWVDRAAAEAAFFAPALRGARVYRQYFGGGTPNLLAPAQLDRLLDLLEASFDHDPAGRRTLEVLPSAYQTGTLEVAARHGVRRISAGVQSTEVRLLDRVGRAPDIAPLARIMEEAARHGVDDVNVDLAWRLPGDTEELFFRSLAAVLDLRPTSVSVHLLAPTPLNPMFASPEEELAIFREFVGFPEGESARRLAETHPEFSWRRLPTVLTLARRDYVEAGRYYTWQYSDMETVGVDMFGLGRFALSHLLGGARYENLTRVDRFDPDEPGFRLAYTDGAIDGAMDAIGELVRDDACDLAALRARYGDEDLAPVRAALDDLVARKHLRREGDRYRRKPDPGSLYLGPVGELLDVAAARVEALNPSDAPAAKTRKVSLKHAVEDPPSVTLDLGAHRVRLFVEAARADKNYYRVVGRFGLYYTDDGGAPRDALHEGLRRAATALEGVTAATAVGACAALQGRLDGP